MNLRGNQFRTRRLKTTLLKTPNVLLTRETGQAAVAVVAGILYVLQKRSKVDFAPHVSGVADTIWLRPASVVQTNLSAAMSALRNPKPDIASRNSSEIV
jgi:hypothetical protein